MMEAGEFMKNFMEKLDSGKFVKDHQPNNGPEINSDFVSEKVKEYSAMLESGVLNCIIKE